MAKLLVGVNRKAVVTEFSMPEINCKKLTVVARSQLYERQRNVICHLKFYDSCTKNRVLKGVL